MPVAALHGGQVLVPAGTIPLSVPARGEVRRLHLTGVKNDESPATYAESPALNPHLLTQTLYQQSTSVPSGRVGHIF